MQQCIRKSYILNTLQIIGSVLKYIKNERHNEITKYSKYYKKGSAPADTTPTAMKIGTILKV